MRQREPATNIFFNEGKFRIRRWVVAPIATILFIIIVSSGIQTIPAGHVGVGVSFGKVQDDTMGPGFHFGNPMTSWKIFDVREATLKVDKIGVPSRDQLTTGMDLSIQYRAMATMAPEMLRNTGDLAQVLDVHLVPNFRNIVRERSKGVDRAEDWFSEEVQRAVQENVLGDLQEIMAPKGIHVSAVLIRAVRLPKVINDAILLKKASAQQAATQEAELARFQIEAQQVVATAQAAKEAAVIEAETEVAKARGEAEANRIRTASLNANILRAMELDIESHKVEKWDGVLPPSVVPFMSME